MRTRDVTPYVLPHFHLQLQPTRIISETGHVQGRAPTCAHSIRSGIWRQRNAAVRVRLLELGSRRCAREPPIGSSTTTSIARSPIPRDDPVLHLAGQFRPPLRSSLRSRYRLRSQPQTAVVRHLVCAACGSRITLGGSRLRRRLAPHLRPRM